jgi:uncharacterized membrane protein YccF (DUF307 family)
MAAKDVIDKLIVWGNKPAILTARGVIWIISSGWWLAVAYVFAGLSMALTIIFIPFVPQALRLAWYAFDPVKKEAVYDSRDAKKPMIIAANVVWAIFFGWAIFLGFLFAALVQALTIVGLPTALTFGKLGRFALMPFGAEIRNKFLPTTVEELRAHKAGSLPQSNPTGK